MAPEITAERLVLSAILRTMKPKRRAQVLALIGEVEAENIIQLRRPCRTEQRNQIVEDARRIAGER